jgi:hypothetical protein
MIQIRSVFVFAMLLLILAGNAPASAGAVSWRTIRDSDVERINAGLRPGEPTVDIGVYLPDNLDPAFVQAFSLDRFLTEFGTAKQIFAAAGVQLRLAWIKTGTIDPQYLEIQSNDMVGETPAGRRVNMYVDSVRQKSSLSPEARAAFESIVERHEHASRMVHVVILQDVFMSFFEQIDDRTYEPRTITTGGLSFPTYSYHGLPEHLRGVITITRNDTAERLLAHELGHKLLNVSHEYRDTAPQHEVRAEGGLMLYGRGTEIPPGAAGRWHRERLHLSPFVYRVDADGKRVWNGDYIEGGHYYDPIYRDYVVRFEPEPIIHPQAVESAK